LLRDGTYRLEESIRIQAPGILIQGLSKDRSKVVLRGSGPTESLVRVAVSIVSPDATVADLTIAGVGWHGIQVHGEHAASRPTFHHIRVADTGQQLLKVSIVEGGPAADRGLVACSQFEYTDCAPSDYTNGVDVHRGQGWVIRDNFFRRIRGPKSIGGKAGPAILVWNGSSATVVERNALIDCTRGIALGLRRKTGSPDHDRGVIRNNVVANLNDWADEGIEAGDSGQLRIEHNTVLTGGSTPWAIGLRFPTTEATVRNNLCNRPIALRDGAHAEEAGNVVDARRDWFTGPERLSFRLARGDLPAVDAGVPIDGIELDFDLRPRVRGSAPDAGAFEFQSAGEGAPVSPTNDDRRNCRVSATLRLLFARKLFK
jgi:hypothetical protein